MNEKDYPTTSGHLVIRKGPSKYVVQDMETKSMGYANESIKDMLLMCDGKTTVDEIINKISIQYEEERESVKVKVERSLEYLEAIGIISINKDIKPAAIILREQKTKWPLDTVYFETTNACNLSCIHCYANAERGLENEMDLGQIKGLMDSLTDLGVLNIVLTGGEPLSHPDIFEIMEYIVEKDMNFHLFTNGVLLDDTKVNKLKKLNPGTVAVSLDGANADTYKVIRVANVFDKVVENIKLLIDAGIQVRINSMVHSGNINEVENLLRLSTNLGANQIIFDCFMEFGRGTEHADLMPPVETSRDIAFRLSAETEKMIEEGSFQIPEITTDEHFKTQKDSEEIIYSLCGVGTTQCTIRADGEVVLCPVLSGKEHSAGNVLAEDIKKTWDNSPAFSEIRKYTLDDIEECKDCKNKADCRGGCKAKCFSTSGKYNSPDIWKCEFYKGLDDWNNHLKKRRESSVK